MKNEDKNILLNIILFYYYYKTKAVNGEFNQMNK